MKYLHFCFLVGLQSPFFLSQVSQPLPLRPHLSCVRTHHATLPALSPCSLLPSPPSRRAPARVLRSQGAMAASASSSSKGLSSAVIPEAILNTIVHEQVRGGCSCQRRWRLGAGAGPAGARGPSRGRAPRLPPPSSALAAHGSPPPPSSLLSPAPSLAPADPEELPEAGQCEPGLQEARHHRPQEALAGWPAAVQSLCGPGLQDAR